MDIIESLRSYPRLHALLVHSGVRFLYRALREVSLTLRHGWLKRIRVAGVELEFPFCDDATRAFFIHPYWFGEIFEAEVVKHLAPRLTRCRIFLDVGAGMGFYTVLAAKLLQSGGGVVHAVEMDADNARRVTAAIRHNGLQNVVLHHTAVGDRTGQVEYFACGSEVNTLDPAPELRALYRTIRSPITTLDDLTHRHSLVPDIVKIDVEGAEYLVLMGMQRILDFPTLQIYLEIHLHQGRGSLASFGYGAHDVLELLWGKGFSIDQLPLRQDSVTVPGPVTDPGQLVESVMLYARKGGRNDE